MNYKLVLFDLDGTLLNTIADLREAVNHAMALRAYPQYTLDECTQMVGHGVRNLIYQALPASVRDDATAVDAALADFTDYYTAHIDVHTRPYPGIQDLVSELHRHGVMMAIASNKFQAGTEHLIKEFFPGIPFVAVLGNRPGYPLKPDPEIVGEVLRKAGIGKEEAVMIGDSPTDMKTAANGGIKGIAVGWGYRNMKGIEGRTVVDSVEELHRLLLP